MDGVTCVAAANCVRRVRGEERFSFLQLFLRHHVLQSRLDRQVLQEHVLRQETELRRRSREGGQGKEEGGREKEMERGDEVSRALPERSAAEARVPAD